MSQPRPVPEKTRKDQARASNPAVSAWVSANAGSGKTHVLAQRVIRLLLSGAEPTKVLCLTFTKAAAANMSARVFDILARWTALDDAALAREIDALTGSAPNSVELVLARRLFARAVETPGGLKIQTIHAFCERVLHQFPFEANVAAGFGVLEELERAQLLATARQAALAAAVAGQGPDLPEALRVLNEETTAFTFNLLLDEMLPLGASIRALVGRYGLDGYERALARELGLDPDENVATIDDAIVHAGIPPARWGEIARALGAGGPGDNVANRLAAAAVARGDAQRMAYLNVFFNGKLERRAKLATQRMVSAHPGLCVSLDQEAQRLEELIERRKAAVTVRRTRALLTLGNAVATEYRGLKSRRGLLDFDDLVTRTLALLEKSSAAWVLYKLDAGIDHILVDEAQDTSADQWRMLERLAADFTAGEGARPGLRTFFAVGDEKQSIFSFQGAAPHKFEEMRRAFERRIRDSAPSEAEARSLFEHVPLHLSFRSVPAVLEAVDDVFGRPDHFKGLSSDKDLSRTQHESWKHGLPGHVEIWEPIASRPAPDPDSWKLPVDVADPGDPAALLAGRIARTVKSWILPGSPERVHGEGDAPRRIRPSDVLILVRTRSGFFEAMIRALKDANVPVAGADRLALSGHIAVLDLVAAGRVALLRGDDLSLACVLKSPLFGLTDDDLLAIAPRRRGSLADALEADPRYREASARLAGWREAARHSAPFEFYTRLLSHEGGRKRFAARLGPEADDAIGEFLRLALDHERQEAPSLLRFLGSVEAADLSIKRDMESGQDSVRVMTVHAAKGLEAKVVILADTCGVPAPQHEPKLFRVAPSGAPDGVAPFLVWSPRKDDDPRAIAEARAAARVRSFEEYRRLLYVAMTRAEERLIVAGFDGEPRSNGAPRRPPECWYDMIRRALDPTLQRRPAPWDPDDVVHWRGDAPGEASELEEPSAGTSAEPAGPLWLFRAPRPEFAPAPPVRPSNALAAADRGAGPEDEPALDPLGSDERTFGLLMHTLLRDLPDVPPERRRAAAEGFVAARAGRMPAADAARLVDAALATLGDPRLAALFGPGSRAEVPIAGSVSYAPGHTLAVTGRIDRLAVGEGEVTVADFKTGSPPRSGRPADSHLVQLALYRAVLQSLYPGSRVRGLLVWTSGPTVLPLDDAALDAALARFAAQHRADSGAELGFLTDA